MDTALLHVLGPNSQCSEQKGLFIGDHVYWSDRRKDQGTIEGISLFGEILKKPQVKDNRGFIVFIVDDDYLFKSTKLCIPNSKVANGSS